MLGAARRPRARRAMLIVPMLCKLRQQARLADPTPANWRKRADGGLEAIPGSEADPAYIQKVNEIKKPNNVLQAGDKKIITAAEDELPNLDGTLEALRIAKDLNSKTFTGVTAGIRGKIGTTVPGAGMLIDKDAAMATSEFGKVMSGEAIKTMADTLKGATTDFELKKFEAMMADPATPPEIRGRMIDRMIKLSEAHKATKVRRINELRGGTYFKPDGGARAAPEIVPDGRSGDRPRLQRSTRPALPAASETRGTARRLSVQGRQSR